MSTANILLVDDRPENLLALEAMLESLGNNLNLVKANSGEEALKCALNYDFAVILLDVQMQDLNGFETALLIKERKKSQHTPIIFLTAFDQGDLQVFRGYSVGAVDYLIKPIVPEILRAKVAIFVDLYLAHESARELDALKAKFMADASHELRTPIASLELRTYLLEHDAEDKRSQHITSLRKQITQLHDLVNDILSFTNLQDGKDKNTFKPLDLNAIVEQVLNIRYRDAHQAGLDLFFSPSQCPLPVYGDEDYLAQAVTHLVVNAIRYTASGSIEIMTDVNRKYRRVCLLVRDTGPGIPPADKAHLFDPFYRGQGVGSSNIPGTGLGLSVTKEIIDLHGGGIDVESIEGAGSTFKIWLPMMDNAAA